MRRIVNEIMHGIGYLLFAFGFLICLESLLTVISPIEGDLLVRYQLIGLAITLTGLFYTWWKV